MTRQNIKKFIYLKKQNKKKFKKKKNDWNQNDGTRFNRFPKQIVKTSKIGFFDAKKCDSQQQQMFLLFFF